MSLPSSKIGKPNDLNVFGSNKANKGQNQGSQNRPRSPMPEGGGTLNYFFDSRSTLPQMYIKSRDNT